MRYKVGMFGGSFDPLHLGHIHDIIRAASMCEELYVMISWCHGRESTSKELRYRWLRNSFRHMDNIRILTVEDTAVSKEVYDTDHYWEKGAADIKALVGKPIDIVFCGSDYLGTGRFESLYGPESVVHYFDRREVPISSTDIRGWALTHWDYIPAVCRPHYVRKVLVVGGESTGKSTLVRNLALAYNTCFVSEVGRDTCDRAGGEEWMTAEDLYENFLRQRIHVMDAASRSDRLLFVDTDALTTRFYCGFLLGEDAPQMEVCDHLTEGIHGSIQWDLVLFLEPDVAFVQDGTRSEQIRQQRQRYSQQLRKLLDDHGVEYHVLRGDYRKRFDDTKKLIEEKFGLTTEF